MLGATGQVQLHSAVHAMHPFVVKTMALDA